MIVGSYINQNRYDEAERLVEEVLSWDDENSYYVKEGARKILRDLYVRRGEIAEYSALFDADDVDVPSVYSNSIHAYRMAINGNAKEALAHVDSAWTFASDIQDTLLLYDCAYNVYRLLGNYREALTEHKKLFMAQDSVVRSAMQQPIESIQRDYFRSLAENNALELRNNKILYMGGIAILILLSILVAIYYRHQLFEKQKKIEDYMNLHHELDLLVSDKDNLIAEHKSVISEKDRHLVELSEKISDKDMELSAIQTQVRNLFSHQYELLNQLCTICYESSSTPREKDAIYTKVKKEIDSFKYDSLFFEKLESLVNDYSDNVMLKLRKSMPMLSEKEYRLMCFFYVGFSAKAISLFTDDTTNNIYVKKKRLKDRISEMKPQYWEEIVSYMR